MTSSATASPHSWFRGGDRAARAAAVAAAHPGRTTRVEGHRRLRGPYTAAGNLLRAVVPDVLATRPELAARHVIEILSVAPELTDRLPAPPQTLTSLASPTERTRYYSPLRTRRLAHGITEFLDAWAAASRDRGPWTLFLDDLDEADPTDQELVAILLRRAHPDALRVVAGSATAPRSEVLAEALERYAALTVLPAAPRPSEQPGERDPRELLRAYVASDGTSDDPAEQAAHAAADPEARAALHLARARELEDLDEWTLHLGAIAYHRSQAGPRSDEEGRALMTAADYCLRMGYYEATVELGRQGRAAFDPLVQERLYIVASGKTAQALGALGRTDEAEAIYHEQRARFTDPVVHMVSAYAISMLYTRAHPQERLDTAVAREYVNNAIAIASQLADPEERAFHTVFQQNGLALVELREGRPETALALVTGGLARLDRELPPGSRALHRSVLLHNRAQVNASLGRLDEALADYDGVVAVDPGYPEYLCDRAALHLRRGDVAAALADYDSAVPLTPPIHELHYNRADARRTAGDTEGALADLRYVLELEPDYHAARVNLVSLLTEEGRAEEAAHCAAEGLLIHPGDAELLCAQGLLAMEEGDLGAARLAFDAALDGDSRNAAALANRAVLHAETGDHPAALADLTRAIDVTGDDPDLLFNRGYVHQAAGDLVAATADYRRAAQLPGADQEAIAERLAQCRQAEPAA